MTTLMTMQLIFMDKWMRKESSYLMQTMTNSQLNLVLKTLLQMWIFRRRVPSRSFADYTLPLIICKPGMCGKDNTCKIKSWHWKLSTYPRFRVKMKCSLVNTFSMITILKQQKDAQLRSKIILWFFAVLLLQFKVKLKQEEIKAVFLDSLSVNLFSKPL